MQGGGYIVSWCVGHLLELADTGAYGEQFVKWRYDTLPILPTDWKYSVKEATKQQLDVLCRLIKDKNVDRIVCATDAGREGELIFRLVYAYAKCKKPVERLWISSMEDQAIRDGFNNLRPGKDYDLLYQAALCRSEADWLVGINATRLFSVLYHTKLNVGRVMSPTLALLVKRESEIQGFQSKVFYVPEITCGGFTASGERTDDKATADRIAAACNGQTATVAKIEKQNKTVQPPKLYDLTKLPNVVFHSLRHSSTTYKLKLNHGDLKATQGDTGHAEIDMITKVYAHILDEDRKINAQKFESAFYSNPDLRQSGQNSRQGNRYGNGKCRP